jgi:esterase/lipase superfamily enzyme
MFRKHEMIPSQAMERRVHLWRFGTFGMPVLVFPSASGMAHEWDAHGMVEVLADMINGGKIKLYCVESNVAEAWTRRETDPRWRIRRHMVYEKFVTEELVSWIRNDCRSERIPIATTGTSLGGYYACNFALKFPRLFNYALCLSSRYDMAEFTGHDDHLDFYYNNPMAYAPNLNGNDLETVRELVHLALVCGQGKWEDGNMDEARQFAAILAAKGISHQLDLWGHDVAHEWAWWRRQVRLHLVGRFGG